MRTSAIILFFLLTGCSTNNGVRWYAPATWFSSAPATKVDNAGEKVEVAEAKVVKAAQKSAHETQIALLTVPESRSTDVAIESNDNTVALLDQVAGPLSAKDVAKIREMVSGLVSENAELRANAEKERGKAREATNQISDKLNKAKNELGQAQDKLRVAFERENELANELRSQRALFWISVVVGILGFAGWIYVRLTLGGLPTALGKSLNELRASSPDVAEKFVKALDVELTPSEQTLIRLVAAKHK